MSMKSLDTLSREPKEPFLSAQEGAPFDLKLVERRAGRSPQETLARLCCLLGEGAVSEARALVEEAQHRWPDSPQVQKWARLLEPPQARVCRGTNAPSRSQEYAWLREHAHEHPAQWLALLGDTLIAADANLTRVLEIVRETGRAGDTLLHFQPAESWPQ
jgi:hypothetical protein